MLSGENSNTNFMTFDLIWPGFESTIYRTKDKQDSHFNAYTIYAAMTTNIFTMNISEIRNTASGVYQQTKFKNIFKCQVHSRLKSIYVIDEYTGCTLDYGKA